MPSGGHGAALLPGLLHGDKAVRSFSSSFQYLVYWVCPGVGTRRVVGWRVGVVGNPGASLVARQRDWSLG